MQKIYILPLKIFTHFSQPPKENNCKDDFKQTRTWTMMMNVISSLEWVNRYIHTACLRAYMHVCVCVHKCILTATPVVWFNYSSQLVVILVWFCTVSCDFLRLHKYSPKDIDALTRYMLCICYWFCIGISFLDFDIQNTYQGIWAFAIGIFLFWYKCICPW